MRYPSTVAFSEWLFVLTHAEMKNHAFVYKSDEPLQYRFESYFGSSFGHLCLSLVNYAEPCYRERSNMIGNVLQQFALE